MLPPLTFNINTVVVLSNVFHVTDLASDTEGFSLHVIKRCAMSFYTFHNDIYPLTAYVANPYTPGMKNIRVGDTSG